MRTPGNSPTEADLRQWLRRLGSGLPPLRVCSIRDAPGKRSPQQPLPDALVELGWNRQVFQFATEFSALSTPKAVQSAIARARRFARDLQLSPLIVTPYLSEENLQRLEREETSGLDLCGNGLIQVKGNLFVKRSGQPNRYPRGATIQNVYRGNSSLVARTFLLDKEFETVQSLQSAVQLRGGEVTLSTVSKVCSGLAEDLVIERVRQQRRTRLRLLQPDKLLDSLARNFTPVKPRQQVTGKWTLDQKELLKVLDEWQAREKQRIARTGAGSTERYATMAREPVARFYCSDLASLLTCLRQDFSETARFANLEITETDDPTVYFDLRGERFASPIQCYLELQAGDKRDQDTAEQVRMQILNAQDNRS